MTTIAQKFKLNNIVAALLLLAGIALPSCVSNNDDEPDFTTGYRAIVTYVNTVATPSPSGEGLVKESTFLYYGPGNATPTTLKANYAVDEASIKQNQRCLLEFIPASYQNPTATGTVTVIRCKGLATSTVETASKEVAEAANAPINVVYLNGLWEIGRTGNYINVQAMMPYYSERTFTLVADETTVDTAEPHLYLTTAEKGDPQGMTSSVIGSIDISPILRNPEVEKVIVHVNNTNPTAVKKVFEFER